jgi:hypothetical protein
MKGILDSINYDEFRTSTGCQVVSSVYTIGKLNGAAGGYDIELGASATI